MLIMCGNVEALVKGQPTPSPYHQRPTVCSCQSLRAVPAGCSRWFRLIDLGMPWLTCSQRSKPTSSYWRPRISRRWGGVTASLNLHSFCRRPRQGLATVAELPSPHPLQCLLLECNVCLWMHAACVCQCVGRVRLSVRRVRVLICTHAPLQSPVGCRSYPSPPPLPAAVTLGWQGPCAYSRSLYMYHPMSAAIPLPFKGTACTARTPTALFHPNPKHAVAACRPTIRQHRRVAHHGT